MFDTVGWSGVRWHILNFRGSGNLVKTIKYVAIRDKFRDACLCKYDVALQCWLKPTCMRGLITLNCTTASKMSQREDILAVCYANQMS